MDYNYLQQGGLASLPTHPILGGQQHELSYITPEEAQLLRSYGGGVTPSGGQYTGPGGLSTYRAPGDPGVSGGVASNASNPGPPSVTSVPSTYGDTNPDFGLSEGLFGLATSDTVDAASDRQLFNIALEFSNEALSKATAEVMGEDGKDPWSGEDRNEVQDAMDRAAILSRAKKKGYVPGLQSLHNLAATLSHEPGDDGGFFGNIQGYKTADGQVLSTPEAVLGLGTKGYADNAATMSTIGDPESPFGRALMGSMDIIGLAAPPIGLLSSVISLADTLGLVDMSHMGDKGLMSLIGDTLGDLGDKISIDGETLSAKASEFGDSIADATGLTSLSDAISDAYGNVKGEVTGLVDAASDAVSDAWSGSDAQSVATAVGEVPGQVATAVGETFSGLGDVPGQVADSVGDTFSLGDTFSSLGDTFSSLGETSLGDMFSGEGSDIGSGGEGGGPGIQMPVDAISPPPPYVSPTFRTDFEDIEPSSESQIPVTMEDILAKYVSQPKEIISAYSGGGIQGLIDKSNERYSVQNQDRVPSFNKATPHPDLMSGSDGYISNILQGHTVPMGMTNVQQMQKPLEAFPTGGQMNSDNTLHANYSQPQSFYSMPNMNRVN